MLEWTRDAVVIKASALPHVTACSSITANDIWPRVHHDYTLFSLLSLDVSTCRHTARSKQRGTSSIEALADGDRSLWLT